MSAAAALAQLAAGEPVRARTVAVVAHPDDETIGCGARLNRLENLLLVHVTDGSPMDMSDARRLGFRSREAYGHARALELDGALAALGAAPHRRCYGVPDQGAVGVLADLVDRLSRDLAGARFVITHPYEGGHPDHDACALAVQLACERLGAQAPDRLEFASYHARDGAMVAQRFWPDASRPAVDATLSFQDRTRKARGFAAHVTQAEVLGHFSPDQEAYREAPEYDFSRPPPPGAWLFDRFGFELTGARWLAQARCAMRELDRTSA